MAASEGLVHISGTLNGQEDSVPNTYEDPPLSRDQRPLRADFCFFPRRKPGAVILWPRVLA
jgi:hypothetical protein